MAQSADKLHALRGGGGGASADLGSSRCVDRERRIRVYHLTEMRLLSPPSDSVTDDFSVRPGAADSAAAEGPGARP